MGIFMDQILDNKSKLVSLNNKWKMKLKILEREMNFFDNY